jgi:hypothetical protein
MSGAVRPDQARRQDRRFGRGDTDLDRGEPRIGQPRDAQAVRPAVVPRRPAVDGGEVVHHHDATGGHEVGDRVDAVELPAAVEEQQRERPVLAQRGPVALHHGDGGVTGEHPGGAGRPGRVALHRHDPAPVA